MKFIAEPVKYKQQYMWKREDPNTSRKGEMGVYWSMLWTNPKGIDLQFCLLLVPGQGYFIGTTTSVEDDDGREYIGPYPDLQTTKAAAEVFITLNQAPVFKRRRRSLKE